MCAAKLFTFNLVGGADLYLCT